MTAPRPVVVIVVLFVLALINLSKGLSGTGTGAEAAGYLFGALLVPALISAVYVWWYRRRTTSG